jgi:hypothetical protein
MLYRYVIFNVGYSYKMSYLPINLLVMFYVFFVLVDLKLSIIFNKSQM